MPALPPSPPRAPGPHPALVHPDIFPTLCSFLPTSSLLVLLRTSPQFHPLIFPLFYRHCTIDLKSPRANNPTSISPFYHFPNPVPIPSNFKSEAFSYTTTIEFVGSHSPGDCNVFNHIDFPSSSSLRSVRFTLPSGRYASWYTHLTHHRGEEPYCPVLKKIRADRVILEVDSFGRIDDVWGRKDLLGGQELVLRIGRVGEDAMLNNQEEWIVEDEDEDEEEGGLKRKRDNTVENHLEDARRLPFQPAYPLHTSLPTLLPSLNRSNVIPTLHIVFLSPSSPKTPISKPLTTNDTRTPSQRVAHHLLALASVCRAGFERITLVNIGVLLFHKYGITRDAEKVKDMQDEVERKLRRLLVRFPEPKGGCTAEIRFLGLEEYLKEERDRKESLKRRAKGK
ncbi:hypothetical protein CI109_105933 [Kwoniella shandongensis]|uniref:Uncharacterized protein n=1 Tax=Kwoniella shandongensis TaxID=1734106 RepID=A0AAJ8LLB0_9TREE